ncbi:MAG: RsmE family RNA methyltransferase [Microthrixaceae bacterium]
MTVPAGGSPVGGWSQPEQDDGPLVFVASLEEPRIDDPDLHHLSTVLRVRDGSPIVLADGAGAWRRATFAERPGDLGPLLLEPVPRVEIGVMCAVIKGDRPEMVTRQLTELGVDHIGWFHAVHGVVRWGSERSSRQRGRLERIAREAAMQCRRARLPGIVMPAEVPAWWNGTTVRWRAVKGAPPLLTRWDDVDRGRGWGAVRVGVAVGPEGGWAPAEVGAESGGGFLRVGLGGRMLRSETAAVGAGSLLAALRDAAARADPPGSVAGGRPHESRDGDAAC